MTPYERTQATGAQFRDASAPETSTGPRTVGGSARTTMSGYLTKKGGIRRNWLERWCEVGAGMLRYYEEEGGKNDGAHSMICSRELRGAIELCSAIDARASRCPTQNGVEIEILTSDRTWRFCAPSEESRARWLAAIRVEAGLPPQSSPQPSPQPQRQPQQHTTRYVQGQGQGQRQGQQQPEPEPERQQLQRGLSKSFTGASRRSSEAAAASGSSRVSVHAATEHRVKSASGQHFRVQYEV